METFSALLAICAENSPVNGGFPSQRPVTQSFEVFLWSTPEKNGWANIRDAGDLKRHRVHYDVTAMYHGHLYTVATDHSVPDMV